MLIQLKKSHYDKIIKYLKGSALLHVTESEIFALQEAGYHHFDDAMDVRKLLKEIGEL